MGAVNQVRAPHRERTCALNKRLLIHQVAANIRMHNQRISGAIRVLSTRHGTPLQAVIGIKHSVLIRSLGLCVALKANAQTRLVHHHKHRAHALMLFAQQNPLGLVIVHHTRRIAVNAHLLFDLAHGHAIAVAQRAIFVDLDLRDDEQGNALDTLRPAWNFRQNKVNNVVGHIVVTRRDENLLARKLVGAITIRDSLCAHQAKVSTTMRLGQVHRACPLACHHLRQILLLLLIRTMHIDRRVSAVGQALIHVERHVRRHRRLQCGHAHDIRQTLTTIGLVTIKRRPAALTDLIKRGLKARRRAHNAVFQRAALGIPNLVQRGQNVCGDLARLFNHRTGEIAVQICVTCNVLLGHFEQVVQDELNVFRGGIVDRHVRSLS